MKPTQRRVKFAEMAELYQLVEDYHKFVYINGWYSPKDYTHFELNCNHDIRTFQKAHAYSVQVDLNVHCIRGLECRASWGASHQVSRRRSIVVQNVLDEQNCIQSKEAEGIAVDNRALRIAWASSQSTFISQVEAIERGLQDAQDVDIDNSVPDEAELDSDLSVGTSSTSSSCSTEQRPPLAEKDKCELELGAPESPTQICAPFSSWQLLLAQIRPVLLSQQA